MLSRQYSRVLLPDSKPSTTNSTLGSFANMRVSRYLNNSDSPPWIARFSESRSHADPAKLTFIREMMAHAWDAYEQYAWGADELKPLSLTKFNWYGRFSLYSTPVDALDTLYIMGMHDRYKKAKRAVLEELDFASVDTFVNVFETNIRIVGGLLSAYDLEGDEKLLKKAVDIADRLIGAFETKTGIPVNFINLATGDFRAEDLRFDGEGIASLAEAGSLQLEFQYLSEITGNPIYAEKALFALEQILAIPKEIPGMYPLSMSYNQLKFTSGDYSIGASGDSFYEYLLKMWISTGDERYWDAYYESAQAIYENMAKESSDGKRMYIPTNRILVPLTNVKVEKLYQDNFYEHLSCFAGGMLVTGALAHRTGNWSDHLLLGNKVTEMCFIGYNGTRTGLGGEYSVDNGQPFVAEYHLRPEVIESIFYMWRYTHDQKYRDWGWQIAQSLNKWTRLPIGFSGIRNVDAFTSICNYITGEPIKASDWAHYHLQDAPIKSEHVRAQRASATSPYVDCMYRFDLQESFFLAETLKYLYLLFTDDDVLPLEKYVFNTEAHPLSIRGFGPRADTNKWMASMVSNEVVTRYKDDTSAPRKAFKMINFKVGQTREYTMYELWKHQRMQKSLPPPPPHLSQAAYEDWLVRSGVVPDIQSPENKKKSSYPQSVVSKTVATRRPVATDTSPAGAAALAGLQPGRPQHKLGVKQIPNATPKTVDMSHHGKAAIAAKYVTPKKSEDGSNKKASKGGVAVVDLRISTNETEKVFGVLAKPKALGGGSSPAGAAALAAGSSDKKIQVPLGMKKIPGAIASENADDVTFHGKSIMEKNAKKLKLDSKNNLGRN
ncbi:hypothetical protein HK096_002731 [Nowakowskiella sp. JEL0078]|nr:hypothetical protein HK096_002731 [Nowakowskiella sp. JEL0078]